MEDHPINRNADADPARACDVVTATALADAGRTAPQGDRDASKRRTS
jgi:hypothetical protein